MHQHDISHWVHTHHFISPAQDDAERRTRLVVALTLGAMFVELVAGWLTGSMALLADGWHMGSHAAALGIAAYAYAFARRREGDPSFSFGTGKVSSLAGYSSALLLAAGALWMLFESIGRLLNPVDIHYQEAMLVAAFGLAINLLSAWLLGHAGHHHGHAHQTEHGAAQEFASHRHDAEPSHHHQDREAHHAHAHQDREAHHAHAHQDLNLKAAYLHVIADALTSILALVALTLGLFYGWSFMDPLMGILGAMLIGHWAWGMARESARVLLDAEDQSGIEQRIRKRIEAEQDIQIADLHVWRIAPTGRACILSLVTHDPRPVHEYRALLDDLPGLLHVTVEVNQCRQPACLQTRRPHPPASPPSALVIDH